MKTWLNILCWRILKRSPVFRYWYRRHMTELLYDLELAEIDGEAMRDKYKGRLERAKGLA